MNYLEQLAELGYGVETKAAFFRSMIRKGVKKEDTIKKWDELTQGIDFVLRSNKNRCNYSFGYFSADKFYMLLENGLIEPEVDKEELLEEVCNKFFKSNKGEVSNVLE